MRRIKESVFQKIIFYIIVLFMILVPYVDCKISSTLKSHTLEYTDLEVDLEEELTFNKQKLILSLFDYKNLKNQELKINQNQNTFFNTIKLNQCTLEVLLPPPKKQG